MASALVGVAKPAKVDEELARRAPRLRVVPVVLDRPDPASEIPHRVGPRRHKALGRRGGRSLVLVERRGRDRCAFDRRSMYTANRSIRVIGGQGPAQALLERLRPAAWGMFYEPAEPKVAHSVQGGVHGVAQLGNEVGLEDQTNVVVLNSWRAQASKAVLQSGHRHLLPGGDDASRESLTDPSRRLEHRWARSARG